LIRSDEVKALVSGWAESMQNLVTAAHQEKYKAQRQLPTQP
jgi:hypothetical protein